MALYTSSDYPVAAEIETLHAGELASFTQCGTWGSAAQRAVIAATARQARSAAGLQDSAGEEGKKRLEAITGRCCAACA